MRLEIFIFGITGLVIANMYTEGKLLKYVLSFQKYYQMIGVAFFGLSIYLLLKYNPLRAKQILTTTNEYVKYLPLDKNSYISPILDFTTKTYEGFIDTGNKPIISFGGSANSFDNNAETKIIKTNFNNSNINSTNKRSVSETKKKFVASRQNWKCGDCGEQLNAWYEVDHKIRLEYGGTNSVDNLVALCRECHGKKTTIENL